MLNLYKYFGMAWYGMTVYMYVLVFNVVMDHQCYCYFYKYQNRSLVTHLVRLTNTQASTMTIAVSSLTTRSNPQNNTLNTPRAMEGSFSPSREELGPYRPYFSRSNSSITICLFFCFFGFGSRGWGWGLRSQFQKEGLGVSLLGSRLSLSLSSTVPGLGPDLTLPTRSLPNIASSLSAAVETNSSPAFSL